MLLNDTVLQIMEPFIRNLDMPHHGSEIAHIFKLNQKTVSNILNSLEDDGLLKSRTVGKNKEFRLNFDDREKTMRFLLLIEVTRTIRFLEEDSKINEIVLKTKPYFKGVVVIFGSYAKGTQKKDSDLDVFSVGEYDIKGIRKVSMRYGIQISVKNMKLEEFKRALKEKSTFINEVVSNHIIICGIEEYLEKVVSEYYGR